MVQVYKVTYLLPTTPRRRLFPQHKRHVGRVANLVSRIGGAPFLRHPHALTFLRAWLQAATSWRQPAHAECTFAAMIAAARRHRAEM
jgi:hypothetical protein